MPAGRCDIRAIDQVAERVILAPINPVAAVFR
jgi:hypothetical protein